MEPFEYVIAFTSIILGLGVAQILTGVSDIVADWDNVKFSIPHSLYILVVFLIHIQDWWWTYSMQEIVREWTILKVLSVLIFPIILYLQARMLFPTGSRQEETDLRFYFRDRWKWMYGLGLASVISSAWNNFAISNVDLHLHIPHVMYASAYIIFFVSDVKKEKYHTIFIVLQLIFLSGAIVGAPSLK
ncbi:hypothetical protein [Reichenbachiella versicolor]|uniref:hypothetical protein n=1 Tax=Reichenbachiella versicolor TaxID=1821036 RepID=UPI000D6E0240|nr:hypothetical protein [Reichenbachiella versicolor]